LPDGAVKNAYLLERMARVEPRRRGCRYRCALVLVEADGREYVFEGSCSGRIAFAPAGEGGFGFDPIVLIPRLGRTLAVLPEEDRRRINHRGRAARKLRAHLRRRRI
jgi:XTP/dITP diphosphohydrolase